MANSKRYDIERRTSSTDAVPVALQGDHYWHDTGTTNEGEKVYYDNASKTYAFWYDGETWLITVIADVATTPTDYFVEVPDQITVSGADNFTDTNGVYSVTGDADGRVKWGQVDFDLEYSSGDGEWQFTWLSFPSVPAYKITSTAVIPPTSGWVDDAAQAPAPTLAYSEDTSFIGFGAFSGTILSSANVLADAWYRAETTAFESLRNFTGCEENDDCFRGFLPIIGDSDAYESTDVWMMTSGASSEFDSTRLSANDALWCSLRSDARIESIWAQRSDAMKFAGLVEAWLKETNNLKETGNLQWVNMTDIPAEPQVYRTDGKIREQYWIQVIDLELVYKTESVF